MKFHTAFHLSNLTALSVWVWVISAGRWRCDSLRSYSTCTMHFFGFFFFGYFCNLLRQHVKTKLTQAADILGNVKQGSCVTNCERTNGSTWKNGPKFFHITVIVMKFYSEQLLQLNIRKHKFALWAEKTMINMSSSHWCCYLLKSDSLSCLLLAH